MKIGGSEQKICICSLLAISALIVYWQVGGFDFIRTERGTDREESGRR